MTNTLSVVLAHTDSHTTQRFNSTVLQGKFLQLCLEMFGFCFNVYSFDYFSCTDHVSMWHMLKLIASLIYIEFMFFSLLAFGFFFFFCLALLLSVYVYMMYMKGYTHVHMFVGVHVCGGQKLASYVFLDHCPFYLLKQVPLLSLRLTNSPNLALQLVLGILPLPPEYWWATMPNSFCGVLVF